MAITLNGTTGIANDGGYTGDGISFADTTPANTLVTTTGGNVGIGTSSPSYRMDIVGGGGTRVAETAAQNGYEVLAGSTNIVTSYNRTTATWLPLRQRALQHEFFADGTERMRIDSSGNLLVGTTAKFSIGRVCSLAADGVASFETKPSTNISYNAAYFLNNSNTMIGRILCSTTDTTYATTSDYRLKENIVPMTGALAKVAALKPVTYSWKSNGKQAEGFIAHELAEVCPQAVAGEKDAVETYIDEDGNEQTRPVYQGIDTSFLVATLTAAIQEQQAIITEQANAITALEARLTALEQA